MTLTPTLGEYQMHLFEGVGGPAVLFLEVVGLVLPLISWLMFVALFFHVSKTTPKEFMTKTIPKAGASIIKSVYNICTICKNTKNRRQDKEEEKKKGKAQLAGEEGGAEREGGEGGNTIDVTQTSASVDNGSPGTEKEEEDVVHKSPLDDVRKRYKAERMGAFCGREPVLSAFVAVMVLMLLGIFLFDKQLSGGDAREGRVKKASHPAYVSYKDNHEYFALAYYPLISVFVVVTCCMGRARCVNASQPRTQTGAKLALGVVSVVVGLLVIILARADSSEVDGQGESYDLLKNEDKLPKSWEEFDEWKAARGL